MASKFLNSFRVATKGFQSPACRLLLGVGATNLLQYGRAQQVGCESAACNSTKKPKPVVQLVHDNELIHEKVKGHFKWWMRGGKGLQQEDVHSPDDGLWHVARLQVRDPHRAAQVLKLVSDVEGWHGLFPFCTHSSFLRNLGDGRKHYKVHFGLRVGPWFVGDVVEYEVKESGDSVHLQSINSAKLSYADHLEYTFSAKDTEDGEADVAVVLKVHARKTAYLAVWQTLESQLVDLLVAAIQTRLSQTPEVMNAAFPQVHVE